jgi:hypothetical protein
MAKPEENKEKEAQKPPSETAVVLKELVDQLLSRQPSDPNNLGLSEEKRRELTAGPAPRKFRVVRCKSEETESTFDCVVVESNKHPNGRITSMTNYKHPDKMFVMQANGGRVPDGMQILKENQAGMNADLEIPRHQLSNQYLQWRWTEFWQKDLRRYVGKGLAAHYCAEEGPSKGLDTPWQMGKVGIVEEAAE